MDRFHYWLTTPQVTISKGRITAFHIVQVNITYYRVNITIMVIVLNFTMYVYLLAMENR